MFDLPGQAKRDNRSEPNRMDELEWNKHSRENLQVCVGIFPPGPHEHEMRVLRTTTCSRSKIVRIPTGGRHHIHVDRGELDERGRQSVYCTCDDCIGTDVGPIQVSVLEQIREPVQDGIELLLALDQATSELGNALRVVISELFGVEHTGGV